MTLSIFTLVPAAQADDPRWVLGRNHGTVVVRAHSPAEARLVAAGAEDDLLAPVRFAEDGVTNAYHSPFRSEELYRVDEDHSGDWPVEGPPAVLAGLDGASAEAISAGRRIDE